MAAAVLTGESRYALICRLGLGRLVSAGSKLMQASLVMAAGWQLSDHLCLAFLMQTILFVAFNQVSLT